MIPRIRRSPEAPDRIEIMFQAESKNEFKELLVWGREIEDSESLYPTSVKRDAQEHTITVSIISSQAVCL